MESTKTFVLLTAGILGASAAGCDAELGAVNAEDFEVGSVQDEIINGTVPTDGSLQAKGAVHVTVFGGTCSGTLISNQHVLTARHCVRAYNGVWGNLFSGLRARLEGPNNVDQTILSSNVFEPNSTSIFDDYAIFQLTSPMVVGGLTDNFYNRIYSSADSTLDGQQLFCIGYGNNTLATSTQYQQGWGTLRTATMTVETVSNGSFFTFLWNSSLQIQAAGDSGSTCFIPNTNTVTGILSGADCDGTDISGNGAIESSECSTITDVLYTSPDRYRSWAHNQILSDLSVPAFIALPPLGSGTTLSATVKTVNGTNQTVNAKNNNTLAAAALRAGWVEVQAVTEPANMLCNRSRVPGALSGVTTVQNYCLSDGIVSSLVTQIIL